MNSFRISSIPILLGFILVLCFVNSSAPANTVEKLPTVLIATLIRNKEHTLPYFLTYLQNLSYPKDRIALWFRSDHNEDNSIEVVEIWLKKFKDQYHNVDFTFEKTPKNHHNESSPTDWPVARFNHLIALKEEALRKGKEIWADYLFLLDADALLTHPETLTHLVSLHLPIVAPMLMSGGLYSNFWCGMTSDYYYQRTDEYKDIYNSEKIGHFPVPMVHTAVLIDLNYQPTDLLTFDRSNLIAKQTSNLLNPTCRLYNGPLDDIIIFASSANCSGVPMFVSNEKAFGYILEPLDSNEAISRDRMQLLNMKTTIIVDHPVGDVLVDDIFKSYIHFPEKHKLTLDHIYMINLERRPERKFRMDNLFRELGLDVEHFPAVDGKKLDINIIKDMGIELFEGYEDPYHHRQMTMGEIGCFLSHYRIWEKMIANNQKEVLIIEDDIRFESYFTDRAVSILEQARNTGEFDLIYFGRKRLKDEIEPEVEKTENLVHVGYSYWTLGYVLTLSGAKKLIASEPLKKLIPVDEYLPVMFNRHPNDTWSSGFSPRNLKAYSAAPLIMFPTHYTGETGYISDTEDSEVTTQKLLNDVKDAQYKSDRETNFAEETKNILEAELQQITNEFGSTLSKHDAAEL
ncbi:glycosyltransferase 25 family member [Episyrphus balteatus]|uniref:glycosyltransferase 25 family member n=1 Tax=Episyrphus balteatus TaxID=286459 RepID=UPI0024868014|nr:glycosyltransferase 25 family member [Episyrphus balteatus]